MNDIEALVYNKVKTALNATYASLPVSTVEDYSPATFPDVQIFTALTSTDPSDSDSSGTEKLTVTTIEASIWTEGSKRKQTAKSIYNIIDNEMRSLGFFRTECTPLVMDKTIFRIVARYDAKVGTKGSDFLIYRR